MMKRITVYVLGILILALGLVLNSKTGLGVSAILCVPFVLSRHLPISFGLMTSIIYFIFVFIQIVLKRKIDLKTFLQIPFSYVFGLIIDFYNLFIKIDNPSLLFGIILLIIAILCTGIGVFMMLNMELIMNPADGFVNTLSDTIHAPFGKVKLLTDAGMLGLGILLSFLFKDFAGIGIGTVVAAFLTGNIITLCDKYFGRKLAKINLESRDIHGIPSK